MVVGSLSYNLFATDVGFFNGVRGAIGLQPIELTRLEFDLLHCLLLHAGKVLSRERLLEQAWGYDFAGDTRAVDSAIKRLRAALRRASPEADGIEAVRGIGYRLSA